MCQISSLMAAAEGPVAEFSSFGNFEEKKRKSNFLISFPKTGNQMGSFGQIRKICFSASVGRFSIFSDYALKRFSELFKRLAKISKRFIKTFKRIVFLIK